MWFITTNPVKIVIDTTGAGDKILVAAKPSLKIALLRYYFTSSGAGTVMWQSGQTGQTPVALSGAIVVGAGLYADQDLDYGLVETAVNKDLVLVVTGSINLDGYASYAVKT